MHEDSIFSFWKSVGGYKPPQFCQDQTKLKLQANKGEISITFIFPATHPPWKIAKNIISKGSYVPFTVECTSLIKWGLITIIEKQAEVGVPHSRIQVELD